MQRSVNSKGKNMSQENKMKNTKNNKKEDGKFRSKHVNHNPQAESARAVYGLKDECAQSKYVDE